MEILGLSARLVTTRLLLLSSPSVWHYCPVVTHTNHFCLASNSRALRIPSECPKAILRIMEITALLHQHQHLLLEFLPIGPHILSSRRFYRRNHTIKWEWREKVWVVKRRIKVLWVLVRPRWLRPARGLWLQATPRCLRQVILWKSCTGEFSTIFFFLVCVTPSCFFTSLEWIFLCFYSSFIFRVFDFTFLWLHSRWCEKLHVSHTSSTPYLRLRSRDIVFLKSATSMSLRPTSFAHDIHSHWVVNTNSAFTECSKIPHSNPSYVGVHSATVL